MVKKMKINNKTSFIISLCGLNPTDNKTKPKAVEQIIESASTEVAYQMVMDNEPKGRYIKNVLNIDYYSETFYFRELSG
jgi:UV DNA damage repair endonuclease